MLGHFVLLHILLCPPVGIDQSYVRLRNSHVTTAIISCLKSWCLLGRKFCNRLLWMFDIGEEVHKCPKVEDSTDECICYCLLYFE